jgi:hypothetical protein
MPARLGDTWRLSQEQAGPVLYVTRREGFAATIRHREEALALLRFGGRFERAVYAYEQALDRAKQGRGAA